MAPTGYDVTTVARSVRIHWLFLFALVALGYAGGYELAQHWFSAADQGASFFPPAGVTLGALVLVARRQWPVVLAAAGLTELVLDLEAGTRLLASLGLALANVAEPLIGALLLTATVSIVDLRHTRDLTAFLGWAVITAPMAGAAIAATTFVVLLDGSGWTRFAIEWWSGDGLGVLVVGSALIALRPWPRLARRSLMEAGLLAAAAVAATAVVFEFGWFELVYVPVAVLVVVAFRVGTAGVAVTGAAVAFVAAGAASEAKDFWGVLDVTPANRVLYLQLGLAVVISAALALAAEISGRERIAAELARSESENRAAAEAELLARLGETLERATGVRERGRALAETLAAELDGTVVVRLVGDDTDPESPIAAGEQAIDVSASAGLSRTADAALSEDRPVADQVGDVRLLATVLRARGRALGTLAIGSQNPRLTVVLLQRIATRAALALDNALLYERERSVSHSLQLSLLGGDPSPIPGAHVATAYIPGTATLEVGGDWYDVFALPNGQRGLVVGDVVGHGLDAAKAMGQLRGAVRALAPLGGPADLLGNLDVFVESLPEAGMATLAYVQLDAESGRFRYAAAGHPPPLVVAENSDGRLLWEGRSAPLGSSTHRGRIESEDRLLPGDTLLLYTDGLVERRDVPLDTMFDALVDVARSLAGGPPEELVSRILRSLVGDGSPADDVCVLALRFVGDRFTTSFPATRQEIRTLRHELDTWLANRDVSLESRRDLVLAISEAAANAAEHAHGFDGEGRVQVNVTLADDGSLEATVADDGTWLEPRPESDRGRGRVIIEALVDELEINARPTGTVVRMYVRPRTGAVA